VLNRLGIESRLQFAVTLCVVTLIVVTTLGNSGGAAWVFFTYRTLLVLIAILCAIGSRGSDFKVSRTFLTCTGLLFALTLISVLRIPGSHFEAFYLWSKYAFFAAALINLAQYARYQSARWRATLLATIVAVGLAHLLPDLIRNVPLVKGFSTNNPNYFATFLLIGLAVSIAAAVFAVRLEWRAAAGSHRRDHTVRNCQDVISRWKRGSGRNADSRRHSSPRPDTAAGVARNRIGRIAGGDTDQPLPDREIHRPGQGGSLQLRA
jgi:hypothetical protein